MYFYKNYAKNHTNVSFCREIFLIFDFCGKIFYFVRKIITFLSIKFNFCEKSINLLSKVSSMSFSSMLENGKI